MGHLFIALCEYIQHRYTVDTSYKARDIVILMHLNGLLEVSVLLWLVVTESTHTEWTFNETVYNISVLFMFIVLNIFWPSA